MFATDITWKGPSQQVYARLKKNNELLLLPTVVWPTEQTTYWAQTPEQISMATTDTERRWQERKRDLSRMKGFQDNWDGFGAEAPSAATIQQAELFLFLLRKGEPENPPMRVVLSDEGVVAFEWVQAGTLLQAEILDSSRIEWMFAVPGQQTQFQIEQWNAGIQEQVCPPASDVLALSAAR
jgi:hypothetical protein